MFLKYSQDRTVFKIYLPYNLDKVTIEVSEGCISIYESWNLATLYTLWTEGKHGKPKIIYVSQDDTQDDTTST